MGKLYHGTSLEGAFGIAKADAILSPWYLALRRLETYSKDFIQNEIKRCGAKDLLELALMLGSCGYARHEIEHRVKCVSFSREPFIAKNHAEGFESYSGGVLLECDITDSLFRLLPGDWEKRHIVFVPKQFGLDTLRKVHLTKKAGRSIVELTEAFKKYNPEFSYL